ncbi:lysophospholipid acyltransferase family protein [candidate division WOR-3 bacterium]|nr:lysophospholipid acyltransferase family protein [candidate division WOR-3 bacterium]
MSAFANLIPYLAAIQRSLPKEMLYPTARYLGGTLALVQHRRKKALQDNLENLGLDLTEDLARSAVRNWTVCLSDQIRSLWLAKAELQRILEVQGIENLLETISQGKGVILVSAHLGNYELGGSYLASLGIPIHAVVEEIDLGHTHVFNRIRRRFGMGVVVYSDTDAMIRILRQGEVLVLLTDRDFGTRGMMLEFGKGIRSVPTGPALLAERTDAAVQIAYCVLDSAERRYRLVIEPRIVRKARGSMKEKVTQLTREISARLAEVVGTYPDQWFVFQPEFLSTQ